MAQEKLHQKKLDQGQAQDSDHLWEVEEREIWEHWPLWIVLPPLLELKRPKIDI
jgi:hypothetical protein